MSVVSVKELIEGVLVGSMKEIPREIVRNCAACPHVGRAVQGSYCNEEPHAHRNVGYTTFDAEKGIPDWCPLEDVKIVFEQSDVPVVDELKRKINDLADNLISADKEVKVLKGTAEDFKDDKARLVFTIRTLNGQIDGLTKTNEELRLSVDVLTKAKAKKKEDLKEQEDKPRKLDL